MLFTIPTLSDDVYRYIWDGRIQKAGINPFTTFPAEKELNSLRDTNIYPKLNSKNKYDPYQPVAQLFFLLVQNIKPDSVLFMKFMLVLFDVGSIFLIVMILRKLNISLSRVLIYAWCPLVIIEIGHSGHIDGLIVFFLVAAILARIADRPILTGIMLGLAVPIKLYPIFLIPAFFKKWEYKLPLVFFTTLGIVYLPYLRAGWQVFRFIFNFQEGPQFNAGLRYFFHHFLGGFSLDTDRIFLVFSLIIVVLVSIIVLLRKEKNDYDFIIKIFIISAVFIVFMPFLVGWYLLFIIPLLCLKTSPGFLYLSGAIMLSYLFYAYDPWQIPGWVRSIEYIPFYLLIFIEIVWLKRQSTKQLE